MKKSIFLALMLGISMMVTLSTQVFASNRCFGCKGGSFVQYTGKSDNAARKKAENCGCKVTGTTACPADRKKILCTVN